jgi:CRISPR-associated protein Cmr5
MSQQQTLQQRRAKQAWEDIESVKSDTSTYSTVIRRLPSLIQQNGLLPTLAYLKAKDEGKHLKKDKAGNSEETSYYVVYRHLSNWVKPSLPENDSQEPDFIDFLRSKNSYIYRLATTEALAYASWLKRFAEAKGWEE